MRTMIHVRPNNQVGCSRPSVVLAALVSVTPLALIARGEGGTVRPETCPRSPARAFAAGSVTVVEEREPPCRIEFRDTGIRLEAVADGSRPDPGATIVVDSDGRFIAANAPGWPAIISVWDTRGRYLYSFGGEGEGPGELTALGALNLLIDGRDRLHVRDGSARWSVFSEDHEFVRRVPANVMGGLPWMTTILDSGSALASDGLVSNRSHHFRVTDSTGALERVFGPVAEGSAGWDMRGITHFGGDTFWAGPGFRGADAYVLEEWGIDGELRRTFRRDAPWWRWSGEPETSARVRRVHNARNGLLYVLAWRPTDEYLKEYARLRTHGEQFPADRPASLGEMVEHIVEVIDTRSGELLASEVYTARQLGETVPTSFFRGSLVGYRYNRGDGGLPFVEIVTLELVPR